MGSVEGKTDRPQLKQHGKSSNMNAEQRHAEASLAASTLSAIALARGHIRKTLTSGRPCEDLILIA
jgi:hypothetical protein